MKKTELIAQLKQQYRHRLPGIYPSIDYTVEIDGWGEWFRIVHYKDKWEYSCPLEEIKK